MLVRDNKDKNTKLYLIMPKLDQATQPKGELWALTLATPCIVRKKYVFVADISQLCWEVESLNLIWLEYVTQDLFQNTQEFLVFWFHSRPCFLVSVIMLGEPGLAWADI